MAIGIGDMTVRSYINQPLQADIAVLQPDAADLLQTVLSSGDEAQREHVQSLLDSLE